MFLKQSIIYVRINLLFTKYDKIVFKVNTWLFVFLLQKITSFEER